MATRTRKPAPAGRSASAKKTAPRNHEEPKASQSTVRHVIFALVCGLIALGNLIVVLAAPGGEVFSWIRTAGRGLFGDLFALSPILFGWLCVLGIGRASGRRAVTWRIALYLGIILCIMTGVEVCFLPRVLRENATILSPMDLWLKVYRGGYGGGMIGALLGYPLHTVLGVWPSLILLAASVTGLLAATGVLKGMRSGVKNAAHDVSQQRMVHRTDRMFEVRPAPRARSRARDDTFAAEGTGVRIGTAERGVRSMPRSAGLPSRLGTPAADVLTGKTHRTAAEDTDPLALKKKRASAASPAPDQAAQAAQAEQEPQAEPPEEMPKPVLPERKPAKQKAKKEQPDANALAIEPDAYEAKEEPFTADPTNPKLKRHTAPKEEPEGYNYPPIDLLAVPMAQQAEADHDADLDKAELLIGTLKSFGIATKLTGIAHGPAVTRFELQPSTGVKVSRIKALEDDIAMNLAAVSVRIEAPIPGKAAVGVEVPNDSIETVSLRAVLESQDAKRHASRIAVGLGKDNAGRYIIADIAKMPHVLIAGQTGSGKSVCINSIIMSILFRATPDEVKMILIDPKVVELSVYNGIPHLIAPVVTDPKKAASALEWAVVEMSKRYRRFAEKGVRDIKGYNKALKEGEEPMPHMVIIIDELADLMMVAPKDVEDAICRLAQLARAAGMHLVIATQRPSVNVITGIIKANIPTRIAFLVTSQVDSRTIIDHGGAEKLLGHGDMLYVPAGIQKPMRVQGSWVSDEEVQRVVDHIKEIHPADYDEDVIEQINNAVRPDAEREEEQENGLDERLEEAIGIVLEAGQASVSMLQRRMRVGYARAGRLIDDLARRGIISEADGSKPRTVLMTREQYALRFGEEGGEEPAETEETPGEAADE